MKAMKAVRAPSKAETLDALADVSKVDKKQVKAVLDGVFSVALKQLKASGKFVIPGVTMVKLKKKPATKAGSRVMFGKTVKVKAKPAKTVVKCYAVKALKDEF